MQYEDNIVCIAQLKGGYIEDTSKEIGKSTSHQNSSPHDLLEKYGDIDVQWIRSKYNLTDFFTKALPIKTFEGLQCNIGMRQLKDWDDIFMRGS